MNQPTHAYIGRCKQCRAILGSVYDMSDDRKGTGDFVAKMITRNLAVEKVPLAALEGQSFECVCTPAVKQVVGLPLFAEEVGN